MIFQMKKYMKNLEIPINVQDLALMNLGFCIGPRNSNFRGYTNLSQTLKLTESRFHLYMCSLFYLTLFFKTISNEGGPPTPSALTPDLFLKVLIVKSIYINIENIFRSCFPVQWRLQKHLAARKQKVIKTHTILFNVCILND